MPLHHHSCPIIGGLGLVDDIVRVEFDPWGCEHVVDETVFSVAPISRQLLQLETNNFIVCVYHCIHICMQPLKRINSLQIKFNFKLVVGIRADHEIHVVPIGQKQLF